MTYIREHKKLSIIVLIALIFFVFASVTFGKYIYNVLDNYILETKGFYFNSSVLSFNKKEYKINNWDGANSYPLTIDLNNKKNAYVSTDADIRYSIQVSCTGAVTCELSSSAIGYLYKNDADGMVSFGVTMTPNPGVVFSAGDTVEVNIDVTSLSPYKKKLSAKYLISVESKDFSYNIEDSVGDSFFVLNLTNSIAYYEVERAFGSYAVGDLLNLEEYNSLTASQKQNCFSAVVTLSFDPTVVYLDMTNKTYLHRIPGSESKINVNGHPYVNGYKFKVDATTSEKVIFYKVNPNVNYTYPLINGSSIIDVSEFLA